MMFQYSVVASNAAFRAFCRQRSWNIRFCLYLGREERLGGKLVSDHRQNDLVAILVEL